MENLKGTKTLENLMKAFAGESQARNRYTYYASIADKEGFKQIKDIFLETAENEKEHGKRFYKLILEGMKGELPEMIEINASYPVAQGNTEENLIAAANGEKDEWSNLYNNFGKIAQEEGFTEVADAFKMISTVEKHHESRYRKLASNINKGMVFKKESKTSWKCSNCGYIHEGEWAPNQCPACIHPQAYFEVSVINY